MALPDALFYLFAFLTLLFGALVVANPFSRNPVTSAMFLVLTICAMAGLFVLLNAFFLAAVQILVYAGAVMVLFLFVIMLLDLKEEQRRKINLFGIVTGTLRKATDSDSKSNLTTTLRVPSSLVAWAGNVISSLISACEISHQRPTSKELLTGRGFAR